ncbi:hypothetical protein XENOCAPTIV_018194, partial [Xenoophorus captivus]
YYIKESKGSRRWLLFLEVSPSEYCLHVTSAGGTGVLLNVDQVAEQMHSAGHRGVQVRGLADSGWFLDNKQYKFTDCLDTISCAPTEAIKRGIRSDSNGGIKERLLEKMF